MKQDTDGHVKALEPLSLKQLGELLIKHYDLHEGLFDVSLEFGLGVGPVGPNQESLTPGVIVTIQKVGLLQVPKDTPQNNSILDASKVNAVKKRSSKTKKKEE
jgi:hypothetical protein